MAHPRRLPLFLPTLLLLLLHGLPAMGREAADTNMVRIGVAGTPPFVTDGTYGISMDIWREIAGRLGKQFTAQTYPSVPEALDALEAGQLDAVVGPVNISADLATRVGFTQPYFRSSLSILSRTEELNIWERVEPFFSMKLLYAVCGFLFILACVGTLLWLAERKASPEQFPRDPARGIGNGMWCAIATMTTTGYGDIAPVTLAGRVVAGAWMVISIIFATSMVAGIASTLTLTGMMPMAIDTAEKLPGRKVAFPAGSPAGDFVAEHGGITVPEANLDSCYAALLGKRVDAVVFDRPQLLYFTRSRHDAGIAVSSAQYQPQGYGFAFPLHASLMPLVDVELLRMRENGDLQHILRVWLGDRPE